jgi:CheY-like chemotaxis protein
MNVEEKTDKERIIVAVDDMFFAAKILSTAEQLGRTVERVKTREQLSAALVKQGPALLLIDLNSTQWDALEVIASCKSLSTPHARRILGFLSHVQVELKGLAEAAGCDVVMPRSAFAQALPAILSGKLPNSSAKHP